MWRIKATGEQTTPGCLGRVMWFAGNTHPLQWTWFKFCSHHFPSREQAEAALVDIAEPPYPEKFTFSVEKVE